MTLRARSFFLLILPAIFLLGSRTSYVIVPTVFVPTPIYDLKPGTYYGTINLSILDQISISNVGGSRDEVVQVIDTTGNIDIIIPADRRWSINVDIPIPITTQDQVTSKEEGAKCKGWTVNGSGYGTAKGKNTISTPPLGIGSFWINPIEFTLSSMSARIKKDGECDSETWGPSLRKGVKELFGVIFNSNWNFTITHVGSGSLAGTCDSQSYGKFKGQTLVCCWRVYSLPAFPDN
jgi:hypothetical protein